MNHLNAIDWESTFPGVFSDLLFCLCSVDTVELIIRHITVHPLNTWAQILQHLIGLLRDLVKLFPGKLARSGDRTLDDELGQVGSPFA